jgi:hypothetical protein
MMANMEARSFRTGEWQKFELRHHEENFLPTAIDRCCAVHQVSATDRWRRRRIASLFDPVRVVSQPGAGR